VRLDKNKQHFAAFYFLFDKKEAKEEKKEKRMGTKHVPEVVQVHKGA